MITKEIARVDLTAMNVLITVSETASQKQILFVFLHIPACLGLSNLDDSHQDPQAFPLLLQCECGIVSLYLCLQLIIRGLSFLQDPG